MPKKIHSIFNSLQCIRKDCAFVHVLLRICALVLVAMPGQIAAADLRQETIKGWNEYVKAIAIENQNNLAVTSRFLSSDRIPEQISRLQKGDIVVSPASPHVPLKVPSGLIHDWIGAIFIPDVTLSDVLSVVRNYGFYKWFYNPNVIDSKLISTAESRDLYSLVLMNKSAMSRIVYDTDYQSSFIHLDNQHWVSITETTRIQEIKEYGTPFQHTLQENKGTGFIWRLSSISRFEERDGGVYMEMEVIALSRDIPTALRWLVEPIVRQTSRSVIRTSLQQTKSAMYLATGNVSRSDMDHLIYPPALDIHNREVSSFR